MGSMATALRGHADSTIDAGSRDPRTAGEPISHHSSGSLSMLAFSPESFFSMKRVTHVSKDLP